MHSSNRILTKSFSIENIRIVGAYTSTVHQVYYEMTSEQESL